ncbi:LuxR C-terminal-related transcriptional regulator [Lysinibacillus sp. Ag94]|uniref:LuxR C-terminal-related transcriptional regulator n=1 Tax=Lysinibacillus sp. Ag94 TaxID=2936682 RepID=UPI00200D3152|nr:LuxR C-terminal-related transcriptional regulator [Lysinibacillus sp. Ag94]UPW84172.1 LuxR C-terminal-related transcriptional regulator [Lysinibacillus sp. Ag94]
MIRPLKIAIIDRNLSLVNQTHLYLKSCNLKIDVQYSLYDDDQIYELNNLDNIKLDLIIMSNTNLSALKMLREFLKQQQIANGKDKPNVIIFDDTVVNIERIHLMWAFSNSIILNRQKEDLLLAIQTVFNGGFYYSKEFSDYNENRGYFRRNANKMPLTKTEISVVKELIRDKTNQEIANTLYMSRRTVEYHITSCIQKFEVNSRVGLAVKALSLIEGESYDSLINELVK